MPVSFAVLGGGRIGRMPCNAIASVAGASRVAIAQPHVETAEATARSHGAPPIASIERADVNEMREAYKAALEDNTS